MSSTEEPRREPDAREVESLVARCLELIQRRGASAEDEFCAEHPDHAAAIRHRLETLRRAGLLGSAPSLRKAPTPPTLVHAASPAWSGDRIGPYRIRRVLGRGGQATVLLADDTRLPRPVALKVIDAERHASPELILRRFRREAETVSRLDHPAICSVFEMGAAGSTAYIAMRYVPGSSLARRIARAREGGSEGPVDLTPDGDDGSPKASSDGDPSPMRARRMVIRAVLRLAEDVARALHAAHEAGVVHRDVKPGNIMVTPEGAPVILDFGLAQIDEGAATLTRTGDVVGTPAYMAPEQLRGDGSRVDARTDVYALGATLYECLTLRRPFDAPTHGALFRAILEDEPTSCRRLLADLPEDLAVVVDTALAKEPARRYATALDFAEDLRLVGEGRPIRARPIGAIGRLVRWARRRPAVALLLSLLVVSLSSGLAASLRLLAESRRSLDRLAAAALIAEADEELWPRHPDRIPALESWLDRAARVVDRFPEVDAELDEIRSRALPVSKEDLRRDEAIRERRYEALVRRHRGLVSRAAEFSEPHDEKPASSGVHALHAELVRRYRSRRSGVGWDRIDPAPPPERLREIVMGQLAEMERDPRLHERFTWRFADPRDEVDHAVTLRLHRQLARFAETVADVRARLDYARSIARRTFDENADAWRRCLDDLAHDPRFSGSDIRPQLELVPLLRQPPEEGGLWAFWHIGSGDRPLVDEERSRVVMTESSGLVFVLLPGGTVSVGAQASAPQGPNYDPDAEAKLESPVVERAIAPFFISRYEMTQAQWIRINGGHPSHYAHDRKKWKNQHNRLHPVESVTWEDCHRTMRRLGLVLPTEVQWEYAARGGVGSSWWCGDEASLAGADNLCDRAYSADDHHHDSGVDRSLFDGYSFHAPVDFYRPNPFGLYGCLGNVREWCRDWFTAKDDPVAPGDAERLATELRNRVVRGGSFYSLPIDARVSRRHAMAPSSLADDRGLRPARPLDRRRRRP